MVDDVGVINRLRAAEEPSGTGEIMLRPVQYKSLHHNSGTSLYHPPITATMVAVAVTFYR